MNYSEWFNFNHFIKDYGFTNVRLFQPQDSSLIELSKKPKSSFQSHQKRCLNEFSHVEKFWNWFMVYKTAIASTGRVKSAYAVRQSDMQVRSCPVKPEKCIIERLSNLMFNFYLRNHQIEIRKCIWLRQRSIIIRVWMFY